MSIDENNLLIEHKEEESLIADIRGCINSFPNSCASAQKAADMGYTAILLACVYHDKENVGEGEAKEPPVIFLISPYLECYTLLCHMSYEDWYIKCRYGIDQGDDTSLSGVKQVIHSPPTMQIPDILDDITKVDGITEVWLQILNPESEIKLAWDLARQILPKSRYSLNVLCEKASPELVAAGVEGADLDGLLGRQVLVRPDNLLVEYKLMHGKKKTIKNTITLDGHINAEKTVVPIS